MPETPTGATDARPAQLMEAPMKAFLIIGVLTVSVLSGCRGDDGSDDPAGKSSESGPDLDVFLSERFSGEGTYYDFADENGFGPDPVRVRVIAVDGQTLEDDLPAVQEELVVEGHAQLE
jgi:hypothetical protein